jgi:hypothetical protein
MNFKKILIYILPVLFVFELQAQHKDAYNMAGICLINNKSQKQKIIHVSSNVKYWVYYSNIKYKGRIIGISDSSVYIKDKEVKLKNITQIGMRSAWEAPAIVASLACCVVSPFIIVPVILANRNYDMIAKWKFGKNYTCALDTLRFNKYKKKKEVEEQRQNDPGPIGQFFC